LKFNAEKGEDEINSDFIEIDKPNIILDALKLSEDGSKDLIIRVHENLGMFTKFELKLNILEHYSK